MDKKQANENLVQAVKDCLDAYDYNNGFVLTDFVVLCAQVKFADDGEPVNVYTHLFRDGQMPWHNIFGVIHANLKALEQQYLQQEG